MRRTTKRPKGDYLRQKRRSDFDGWLGCLLAVIVVGGLCALILFLTIAWAVN